jgi:putative DNA primase/helicase
VLSTQRTLPTARAYVREFHLADEPSEGNGRPKKLRTLHAHAGRLLGWQDNRYAELEDGAVRSRLQPWLHAAKRYSSDGKSLEAFPCNPSTVQAALETIRSHVHVPRERDVPFWVSGPTRPDGSEKPDPREILPCRTLNYWISRDQVLPATPDLFTFNALEFDFDREAPAPPEWLKFLQQLWPDDPAAIELLQEWFGYSLTADTSQQKMLLIVGPKRSGKGTIGRVLTELIGSDNVAGPTTSSLAGPFGLQPLLGKSLAVVSDARFSGQDVAAVVERLLCISGEDSITIDRKHTDSVTCKLPVRFLFLSNELPRLHDAAGAMAGRFLILTLQSSFYGREDPALTKRLLAELPGILNWAILGWDRLHDRGRFVVPESSKDSEQLLADLGSPVAVFVRERCEFCADGRITVDELYADFRKWCEVEGRNSVLSRQSFGRELLAGFPGLKSRRNHATGRFYEGLQLRNLINVSDAPADSDASSPPCGPEGAP